VLPMGESHYAANGREMDSDDSPRPAALIIPPRMLGEDATPWANLAEDCSSPIGQMPPSVVLSSRDFTFAVSKTSAFTQVAGVIGKLPTTRRQTSSDGDAAVHFSPDQARSRGQKRHAIVLFKKPTPTCSRKSEGSLSTEIVPWEVRPAALDSERGGTLRVGPPLNDAELHRMPKLRRLLSNQEIRFMDRTNSDSPRMRIPGFRREVSFVGETEGFSLFGDLDLDLDLDTRDLAASPRSDGRNGVEYSGLKPALVLEGCGRNRDGDRLRLDYSYDVRTHHSPGVPQPPEVPDALRALDLAGDGVPSLYDFSTVDYVGRSQVCLGALPLVPHATVKEIKKEYQHRTRISEQMDALQLGASELLKTTTQSAAEGKAASSDAEVASDNAIGEKRDGADESCGSDAEASEKEQALAASAVVGQYSKEERARCLERYRRKRKLLLGDKIVRYPSRKRATAARQRVRGRFIKKDAQPTSGKALAVNKSRAASSSSRNKSRAPAVRKLPPLIRKNGLVYIPEWKEWIPEDQRVTIFVAEGERIISGAAAPMAKNVRKYLMKRPGHTTYVKGMLKDGELDLSAEALSLRRARSFSPPPTPPSALKVKFEPCQRCKGCTRKNRHPGHCKL